MSEREPPVSVEAEEAVLGAVLISADALTRSAGLLVPDDFYRPAHRTLWQAIETLHAKGEPVDAVTLAEALKRAGQLADVGGLPFLHTLISTVPTAANAGYYAGIVRAAAERRRVLDVARQLAELARDQRRDLPAVVADTVAKLTEAARRPAAVEEIAPELLDFLKADEPEYDWLVPGLFERQDRTGITSRTVAATSAASWPSSTRRSRAATPEGRSSWRSRRPASTL